MIETINPPTTLTENAVWIQPTLTENATRNANISPITENAVWIQQKNNKVKENAARNNPNINYEFIKQVQLQQSNTQVTENAGPIFQPIKAQREHTKLIDPTQKNPDNTQGLKM